MKKIFCFSILFCLFLCNVSAGGASINEYKGRNYLASIFGGYIASLYENKEDLSQYFTQDQIRLITNNNRLYFISAIAPLNIDSVINRGFIQQGDKYLISDDNYTFAIYNGNRKNITANSFFINGKLGSLLGVGYSTGGQGIFLTELITTDEELNTLEKNMKIIQ